MQGDEAARNAQRVESLLYAGARALEALGDDERERRTAAMGAAAAYASLLRETAPQAARTRVSFKLEFPDGRWDVQEQLLAEQPRVGDLVWFGSDPWQVSGYRQVPSRIRDRQHEFFSCTPVAAIAA